MIDGCIAKGRGVKGKNSFKRTRRESASVGQSKRGGISLRR